MHSLMLPAGHRFPIGKYDKIHAHLSARFGWAMQLGVPAENGDLRLVHGAEYIASIKNGTLATSAVRRLGFPWSPALVLRATRSVGGTLSALSWAMQEGAAGHLAGGTHHAFADRGEGFCVFNDIAVAIRVAQRDHHVRKAAVIDLDVHQGNGTAAIFAGDASVLTVSLHGAKNYPFRKETSALDVPLPDGTTDDAYMSALGPALDRVESFRPELLFFQAGVDVLDGDRLGRMRLSHAGLHARNMAVFSLAKRLAVPLVVTLGGGYHRDIEESVRAHVGVYEDLVQSNRGSYR